MQAALTILLCLDSGNLQSWCPPVPSAAPSWILMRTPGDEPNSLKFEAVITATQSRGCNTQCLPVGNLRYWGHISPSNSAKFGEVWQRGIRSCAVTYLQLHTGRVAARHQNTIQHPCPSNRLTPHIHFCWLMISRCDYVNNQSRFIFCAPQSDDHIIMIWEKKSTQALLLQLNKHLMIRKWHIRPLLRVW